MTDHFSYKKQEKSKGKVFSKNKKFLVLVFVFLVAVFASINFIFKSFSVAKSVSTSSWDGKSTFAVVFGDAIFVYQNDPKKAAYFTLDERTSINSAGVEIGKSISKSIGVPVEYFVNLKSDTQGKSKELEETWETFISYATPIKILTGIGLEDMDTNISRYDALKLWWQAKSVGVNELESVNLSGNTGLNSKQVLGVNSDELNRKISRYFENIFIIKEKPNVKIINSSGVAEAGYLASSFIVSSGANVTGITGSTLVIEKCLIVASSRNYTVNYLAKLFKCDINDASEGDEESDILINLGTDFSHTYFE